DLPEAKAKVLYAVQWPFQKTLLTGKTTHAAWRSKPSWYAVSTEDRTISPDLERFMAKRMGAKTIEVKASHLSADLSPKGNLSNDPGGSRTDLGRRGVIPADELLNVPHTLSWIGSRIAPGKDQGNDTLPAGDGGHNPSWFQRVKFGDDAGRCHR